MAILHPRKVAVYSLQAIGGVGSAASYYELHKKYEHKLGVDGAHFTAFNMCFGPFGGAHGVLLLLFVLILLFVFLSEGRREGGLTNICTTLTVYSHRPRLDMCTIDGCAAASV